MGRHLGIHFFLILVGLGGQVGRQNGAKIDAKRHRKNDGKKKGSRIAKKLEKVPGEGNKGLLEGEEGVVGSTGSPNRLSPEGWRDYHTSGIKSRIPETSRSGSKSQKF